MEQRGAKLVLEPAAHPSWREMSWVERAEAIAGVVFGFGDDIVAVIRANNIVPKKVKWLWPNRVPLGKLTLFVGNPDNGKSLAGTYVTTVTTTGRDWFDAKNTIPPSEVLIFASEDDPEDTTVPRLIAAGANLDRIHFAKMVSDDPNATQEERDMQLDTDILAIKKALMEHRGIRLIIIDPVSNYLGDVEMTKEQNVRRVLTPLQGLASEAGVAILGIMHLNKKEELQAIQRVGGAMAFVGVARAVWLFAVEKNDPDIFYMVRVKMNIGGRNGGLMYRIDTKAVKIEGEDVHEPYVEWLGQTDRSASDMLTDNPVGRPRNERDEGLKWLKPFLSEGPKPAKEVEAQCEAKGFSYRTLERAKGEAGVRSVKKGDVWYWELTECFLQSGNEAKGRQDS